jgi:signal transduction histidine kinase
MTKMGGLAVLVHLSHSNDVEVAHQTVGVIANLAEVAENQNLMVEQGTLQHLKFVLRSKSFNVQREAARLNELVGDMLDLARPRSLQLDSVDVVRLAREVLLLAGRSGRGEDVRVRYEGELRLLVRGDEAQLRQMLWNLVRNAMQASSGGDEVVVRVTRRREGAELAVRDQGAGIAPEARIHLFDAFFTTRSHGTGVGLAVVKQVVEAHGFHIRVGDAGGVGAEFVVRFPSDALVSDAGPEPTGLSSESASAG